MLGPAVLGWVHVDDPVAVMSTIGLALLLFLAGLEIEFQQAARAGAAGHALGFVASFVIALGVGLLLKGRGVVNQPVFVAVS